MTVTELGDVTHNTIISGMLTFWREGAYPIAIVIFTASILIPFLKIVSLSWLCAAATGRVRPSPAMLGKLYWFTELVGRWSMVDIFVVGIVVSLMQLGNYMTIMPGPGALAFAGVVVLTMFAAMSFEPRLLWDRLDENRRRPGHNPHATRTLSEEPDSPAGLPRPSSARRPSAGTWCGWCRLVALLLGAWLLYRNFAAQGPVASVRFDTADGIFAGKTEVRCRSVKVGVVKNVKLADDLKSVQTHLELDTDAERLLRRGTHFWVVKPRLLGDRVFRGRTR